MVEPEHEQMRELSRLLDEWDPIGVYSIPGEGPPPGEYERLVGPVLSKLRAGESPEDIAACLSNDAQTNMGLRNRPDDVLAAAVRIHAWFHGAER